MYGETPKETWSAAFCGRGLVRLGNEDAVAIDGRRLDEETVRAGPLDGGSHLAILADGMGGHALGEIASELAVTTISETWAASPAAFDVVAAVKKANHAIYGAMAEEGRQGMGATVAGVHIKGDVADWFNLGDSRVYLFRGVVLTQLSIDHVPRSDTSPGTSRRSHLITRSLGGGYTYQDVWPATGQQPLHVGDVFLLCSDGLTDVVGDRDIAGTLRDQRSPAATVEALVALASSAGAPDNLSIILLQIGSLPE